VQENELMAKKRQEVINSIHEANNDANAKKNRNKDSGIGGGIKEMFTGLTKGFLQK
jgi:hypothetical protein